MRRLSEWEKGVGSGVWHIFKSHAEPSSAVNGSRYFYLSQEAFATPAIYCGVRLRAPFLREEGQFPPLGGLGQVGKIQSDNAMP